MGVVCGLGLYSKVTFCAARATLILGFFRGGGGVGGEEGGGKHLGRPST